MTKPRIPLEELFRLPLVLNLVSDWAGEQIAFYSNQSGRMELYLLNLITRETRRITNGELPKVVRAGFCWTPDGQSIIFTRDQDGDEQHNLYRLDLRTGESRQLTNEPLSQKYPVRVSPDGRTLSVTSNRSGQMNLFTLDLKSLTWQQLTHFAMPTYAAGAWSPDGEWLTVCSNETGTLKNVDGYIVRRDGTGLRKLFSLGEGSREMLGAWHPGGEWIAGSSDASGVDRPCLVHATTGEVRWLGREGVEETPGLFSRSGRFLTAIRNMDAQLIPVVYNVETGEEHLLKLPPGLAAGSQFVLDDTHLLIMHSAANRRSEALLYDLRRDTYEVLIPAEYGSIDPALFVSEEYVHYPSADGQMVPAILYRPREIPAGAKLPAVLDIHGGPTGQYFRSFSPVSQLLVDRGMVVLQPNFRGSTGYGTAWRDANLLDIGGGDLEDVVSGVAYLAQLGYVETGRVGIMGGSYGGYMTYLATTKRPDLFRAGVATVGITDWLALYEESMEHFRHYIRLLLGDPAENADLYRDRSGLTFAHQLKAKLMILHGLTDPRCPISQARIFRDRLLELGRRERADFEYHEFAQGHGTTGDQEMTIWLFSQAIRFMERHLKG